MRNESHGIQQKRWSLEIGEETQCGHHEPQKSKRGTRRKTGQFKTCKQCGDHFQCEHNSRFQLYCSYKCYQANRTWLTAERSKCLKCHALVGMTAIASGRMIGVSHSVICEQRKRYKINGGGYKLAARVGASKRMSKPSYQPRPTKEDNEYIKSRMADIRSFKRDQDWSYLWFQEKGRRKWHMLTPEQKHFRGQLQRDTPEKRLKKQKRLNQWKANRRRIDPIYRIIEGFRSRLCSIIKSKEERTKDLIGCSPLQLRSHIESQFKKGMSWENYGSYWHVDHIIPVSAFDHTSRKQRQQCWHWTNLQPLEAKENLMKNKKITKPQLSLCLSN